MGLDELATTYYASLRPITSAKEVMFSSLFVCLSVGNFAQKLPNGFVWNFQGRLAMGQWTKLMVKRWWQWARDADTDPYRDTGKTCLGGGMHGPSDSNIANVIDFICTSWWLSYVFMCLLWPPYKIRQAIIFFALWFLSVFFFFSSPNLSGRRLDVYHTSTHGVALVRI